MPAVAPIRRNTPSMLVAVVVMSVLFVGALVAAFFINQRTTTLETANVSLQDEATKQLGRINTLKSEVDELKSSIGKDTNTPTSQIRTDLKAELTQYLKPVPTWDPGAADFARGVETQIKGAPSTVAVFKALRGWVDLAGDRIKDLESEKTTLKGDKESLEAANAKLKKDKDDLNDTLTTQISDLETSKETLQDQHTTDYKELETNLRGELKKVDDENRRLERQVKTDQIKIQGLDDRIKVLQRQLDERTKPPVGVDGTGSGPDGPSGPGVRHTSDGKILRADVDRGVVYLDLGSKDRVPLGMQFRVYSATEKNLDPVNEGKGLIEVTKVGLTLSECRVVKTGEGDMVKGDLVVNPVYKRGQRMKFFVFGRFDLDGDGQPDARGMDRIKQLIAQWGGEVVSKINVNTDYGVMGLEPELPSKLGPDADPITQQQYKNKKALYDQYKQELANLRGLSIPILNQNRFLSFIGYYERQATQ